jgi:hypothetical protein
MPTPDEDARALLLALDIRTVKNVRVTEGTVQVLTQTGPRIFQFKDQRAAEDAFDEWLHPRDDK